MRHTTIRSRTAATAAALTILVTAGGLSLSTASATVEPGTPAKDVHIGLDDDDAHNPFIQPAGVPRAQHMNDTDVLFGRDNDDLLIGRLGGDTLLGGPDADILVGGPDLGHRPGNDVVVGDEGDDVTTWSPGDGNDAVVGNDGYDTMVFGLLALNRNGSPRLTSYRGRRVPHVRVDGYPRLSCTLTRFPAASRPGFQYLVRLTLDDVQTASVREKDIERVLCPGARPGTVRVAVPRGAHPRFHTRPLSSIGGVVGAITSPAG
jgi:Ca2+-binding RTX toxin-like protein